MFASPQFCCVRATKRAVCFSVAGALLGTSVLLSRAGQPSASPLRFQSTSTQASLLELYTSEGCSSCPPADNWLSQLKDSPRLWKEFVPVAFHVDYWDYLGWRDKWGSKEFSSREMAYTQVWRNQTTYTPCLVLNGAEWPDWAKTTDGPPGSAVQVGTLGVTSTDTNHWRVTFTPLDRDSVGYEAHGALLACSVSSDVTAGENRGRRLTHDFVVLRLARAPLRPRSVVAEAELRLDHQGATARFAVAFWVTRLGSQMPLQAIGGFVKSPG
jgi:hypothetical protein